MVWGGRAPPLEFYAELDHFWGDLAALGPWTQWQWFLAEDVGIWVCYLPNVTIAFALHGTSQPATTHAPTTTVTPQTEWENKFEDFPIFRQTTPQPPPFSGLYFDPQTLNYLFFSSDSETVIKARLGSSAFSLPLTYSVSGARVSGFPGWIIFYAEMIDKFLCYLPGGGQPVFVLSRQ